MSGKQRLELTWIGKDEEVKLEPRILIEDPEKSGGDKKTENMLIFGDNLLALKALEQDFAGKIKCIAIDPPYNTGNAFEQYDDSLEHSTWLNLMRSRLEQMHRLLSDDGSIWICIDDDESHYLKVLCDEVFGRINFLANVVWQKRTSPDNRLRLGDAHDNILVFCKNKLGGKTTLNQLPISTERTKDFKNPDNDPRGPWASTDCTAQAGHATPNQFYELTTPTGRVINLPSGLCWRYTKARMEEEILAGRIWFGKDGKGVPRKKTYLSERAGQNVWTWWPNTEVGHNQEAKKEVISLFGGNNPFDTPKPERLLDRILTIATNRGDIVLDSFLGSATTAAVAHKMGRKWIGVELGEHCHTHCIPRLKAVIDGEQGGISKAVNWKGGGGFKYYYLAPSLLRQDKYGHWVIDEQYNANMLAAAMAKHEGFKYSPDETVYWKQGKSTEKDYIYTTTQFMTGEMLDKIHEDMADEESLLICCKSFQQSCVGRFTNITVKKIPNILLGRCEFGKKSYNLNIVHPPVIKDDDTEELAPEPKAKSSLKKKPKAEAGLFDGEAA